MDIENKIITLEKIMRIIHYQILFGGSWKYRINFGEYRNSRVEIDSRTDTILNPDIDFEERLLRLAEITDILTHQVGNGRIRTDNFGSFHNGRTFYNKVREEYELSTDIDKRLQNLFKLAYIPHRMGGCVEYTRYKINDEVRNAGIDVRRLAQEAGFELPW
jgi:hypothetical protein